MDFYQDQIFRELVRELLLEPFAQRHHFQEKNLQTVCREVELAFNSLDGQTVSYQKTRDAVCLILSHLEISGLSELPEGTLSALIEQPGVPKAFSSSPFMNAADYFRALKLSDQAKLSGPLLDRLIGQHLCLEIEKQANAVLNQTRARHFSLEQLAFLTEALGLDPELTEHLFYLDQKKKESLSWENELPPNWLSTLEYSFFKATECLDQALDSEFRKGQAA